MRDWVAPRRTSTQRGPSQAPASSDPTTSTSGTVRGALCTSVCTLRTDKMNAVYGTAEMRSASVGPLSSGQYCDSGTYIRTSAAPLEGRFAQITAYAFVRQCDHD